MSARSIGVAAFPFSVALCLLAAVVADFPTVVADEQSMAARLEASLAAYTTPAAWAVRRKELAKGLLKGMDLLPLPEKSPLNPLVHSRREYVGYSVENVALETMPGFFLTGNLYRPLDLSKPTPVVLCPHGHYRPDGRTRPDQQLRSAHLARMGATVFSYSMVGWDDNQQTAHDDPHVLALQTWNSIRALDYVLGLPAVDPARTAVTGSSGGGTQSLYLALVDDRIKAVAPVVIVYPWAAPVGCCRCEGAGLPIMSVTGANAIELSAAVAPRPQLVVSVGNDATRDFPERWFPYVRRAYEACGKPDHATSVFLPDEQHDYGPSKRKVLYEFLARHLGLPLMEEDSAAIRIESPAELAAVSPEHPLPVAAVKGAEEVARVFRALRRPMTEEGYLFTPPGFKCEGLPARQGDTPDSSLLRIMVRDRADGRPTGCRINVVGPDGNFYQPQENDLSPYALTGEWPGFGKGNRQEKAPIRYYGRYFYSRGESQVRVPSGPVRVEVWKGYEYRPASVSTIAASGQVLDVELTLHRAVSMPDHGYYSGDPHVHIRRQTEKDDNLILDLLEAEGVRFSTILAYNEPAGPYPAVMEKMDSPQFRGLGKASVVRRGEHEIVSGQEYRSSTYGHLNLFWLDELVMRGRAQNADEWPLYGDVGREARSQGGYAVYAHGGYAQAIYADLVPGDVHGVELLQFGVYRGIGLEDWYHVWNAGFRFPCSAASDYPACRKLADCVTYVQSASRPDMQGWLAGMAAGRSFVSTGPMLLLEVDGQPPGSRITRNGTGPHSVKVRVRAYSEVAPITNLALIVNGQTFEEITVSPHAGQLNWLELSREVVCRESLWIAARAWSTSPFGSADAEAHTNPVTVEIDGRAPYSRPSLDVLIERIDKQLAVHAGRNFEKKALVLEYFQRSRDRLLAIRDRGGMTSAEVEPVSTEPQASFDPSARTHSDLELAAFLRPLPPRTPREAQKALEVQAGFEMQLVAAEPLVTDPVAATFDEDGRLYVAQLTDYPYKPSEGQEPKGSIRLLTDADGDGSFDTSTVFADKLLWAAGLVPWKQGLFVSAPPDIWYLKDVDGDGRADVKRKVFTGFGTQNQQGMLNNLTLGADHWIYGSGSVNGGTIRHAERPDVPAVALGGRDFRFHPVTETFESTSGSQQFGTTFDDWGNRFLCTESAPLFHAVLTDRYLARNPFLPIASTLHNLAPGPVPVFRTSPVERWRMIRSARRIAHGERPATSAGASHHVIDAAAGVTVYRGGAYPPEFDGNVFVGDAQNNLIHRRVLEPAGVTFSSRRADEGVEFVRSSDNWFRPVNFVNAPDGTLWVLDLSREVLEAIHIPLDVATHLDLTRGRDQGRIYRLAPPGFRIPPPPQLGSASISDLVSALENPHGWWRDTAHRLIFERRDPAAVPLLRALASGGSVPRTRLLALSALDGLGALEERELSRGLSDDSPRVREGAVRLAEPYLDRFPGVLDRVIGLCNDDDPRIRLQTALSLGESGDARAGIALARMAEQSMAASAAADPWMRTAILSSTARQAGPILADWLGKRKADVLPGAADWLASMAAVVGARNDPQEVRDVLTALGQAEGGEDGSAQSLPYVRALGSGLVRAGSNLDAYAEGSSSGARLVRRLLNQARATALDANQSEPQRLAAVLLLSMAGPATPVGDLASLLRPQEAPALQLAAIDGLARQRDPAVADTMLSAWPGLAPEARQRAVEVLISREEWTAALLSAIEAGDVLPAQIDAARRQQLLGHRSGSLAARARNLLETGPSRSRLEVLDRYQPALTTAGDAGRGRTIFEQSCSVCHQVSGQGYPLGPDLTSSSNRDPADLLVHVLDPNREVLPKFELAVLTDVDGRSFTGIVGTQTAASVTLRRERGEELVFLRSQIDELATTGRSLMPEGFEQTIDVAPMADLLEYLASIQAAPTDRPAPLPIGTEPGLIEPDR
jgi:putative membrane-bound dehydrogenase-like protein